jgi:hypothetical protein
MLEEITSAHKVGRSAEGKFPKLIEIFVVQSPRNERTSISI